MKNTIIIITILAMYIGGCWFAIYEEKHDHTTNKIVLYIFFFLLGFAVCHVAKGLSKKMN